MTSELDETPAAIELRALAEARLGLRFDIRTFHGVGMGSGAVGLVTLAAIVGAWLDADGRASAPSEANEASEAKEASRATA
jgi:hypothetical protein